VSALGISGIRHTLYREVVTAASMANDEGTVRRARRAGRTRRGSRPGRSYVRNRAEPFAQNMLSAGRKHDSFPRAFAMNGSGFSCTRARHVRACEPPLF
jgi:hypothetical protein